MGSKLALDCEAGRSFFLLINTIFDYTKQKIIIYLHMCKKSSTFALAKVANTSATPTDGIKSVICIDIKPRKALRNNILK